MPNPGTLTEGTWVLKGSQIDFMFKVRHTHRDTANGYFRITAYSSPLPDTVQKDRIELFFGSKPVGNVNYKIVAFPSTNFVLAPNEMAILVTDYTNQNTWLSTGLQNTQTGAKALNAAVTNRGYNLKINIFPNTLSNMGDTATLKGSIIEMN